MGKADGIKHFIASRKGQIVFNYLYSWGAAIVIIGAMFKIIHLPFADYILMAGMITEALVFFFSAFDHISSGSADEAGVVAGVFNGTDYSQQNIVSTNTNSDVTSSIKSTSAKGQQVSGHGSVVVIAGGGVAGTGTTNSVPTNVNMSSSASPNLEGVKKGTETINMNNQAIPSGYAESLSSTAQNLEDFSTTIQSLNEASQKLLGAYKNVTETQGFVENLTTLNQNVSGLNDVFSTQLQTITEQMSAIRYINDSLNRMKNLYDGAIGDSYMFKEESAKMTKHIEALNHVYARLLQAMTANNNNMNQNNF